ncbi:MAG: hypothetical protein AAF412_08290 [Pseudomonadota bacterium]
MAELKSVELGKLFECLSVAAGVLIGLTFLDPMNVQATKLEYGWKLGAVQNMAAGSAGAGFQKAATPKVIVSLTTHNRTKNQKQLSGNQRLAEE